MKKKKEKQKTVSPLRSQSEKGLAKEKTGKVASETVSLDCPSDPKGCPRKEGERKTKSEGTQKSKDDRMRAFELRTGYEKEIVSNR